jgi:hypothetical protein
MIQTISLSNSPLNHIITDNNNTHMKTVQLTPREFYLFKQLFTHNYVIELIKGQSVFIRADIKHLESLGF